MSTTAKAPAYRFTVNVPVKIKVKDITVWPGKPWEGKVLPPQVSIKFLLNGNETKAYLPGAAWRNLKALLAGNVITSYPEEAAQDDLAERTVIPVAIADCTATLSKQPGEKYENMVFDTGTAPKAPAPKSAPRASGPTLPNERPGEWDESIPPEPPELAAQHGTHAPQRETDGTASDSLEDRYLALYERVAARICTMGTKHEFPVDATAVQAATATIWISARDTR